MISENFKPAVGLGPDGKSLEILDQTLLPNKVEYLSLHDVEEIFSAIRELKVRGAPAIGIAAAYGCYLGIRNSDKKNYEELRDEFSTIKDRLASSRPTAVNLFWALKRMENRFLSDEGKTRDEVILGQREEADAITAEDEDVCRRIGEHSLTLLRDGWGLLTHCNAGAIATARYGTALAPMHLGAERGYSFRVYADESRPLLQGARLTAWELQQAGVEVILICDNMASLVMKKGWVQAVLVGCDRVAANGDSANKIGTSGVAILANYYDIPFYIHAPLSTIDMECGTGDDIVIEERAPEEVTEKWYTRRMAPEGIGVYNPAFDVTDHEVITAIITEKGIIYPPYDVNLPELFR